MNLTRTLLEIALPCLLGLAGTVPASASGQQQDGPLTSLDSSRPTSDRTIAPLRKITPTTVDRIVWIKNGLSGLQWINWICCVKFNNKTDLLSGLKMDDLD